MKYVVDLDALEDCLDLLYNPTIGKVYLNEIKRMIDVFPKEEYSNEHKQTYRDVLSKI